MGGAAKWSRKHVPFAPNGEEDIWLLGMVTEFLAEPGNVHVDGAGGDAARVYLHIHGILECLQLSHTILQQGFCFSTNPLVIFMAWHFPVL